MTIMMKLEEVKNKLAAQFAQNLPTSEQETRICLFLQNIHSANAAILAKIEFQQLAWQPYLYLHEQLYKNAEFITLLGKATKWTMNPLVYMEATQLNLMFWQKARFSQHILGFFQVNQQFYEYLALSHALWSVIRFVPLFPPSLDLHQNPFLSTLNQIEEENGRQIQVQIRLLKDMPVSLSVSQKEELLEKERIVVSEVFYSLLTQVAFS